MALDAQIMLVIALVALGHLPHMSMAKLSKIERNNILEILLKPLGSFWSEVPWTVACKCCVRTLCVHPRHLAHNYYLEI